jgi:hypothetical protein
MDNVLAAIMIESIGRHAKLHISNQVHSRSEF